MAWTNHDALHRHAYHAWEDFSALRKLNKGRSAAEEQLLHSLSHHLRHAVFRSGLEVDKPRAVRRRFHQ